MSSVNPLVRILEGQSRKWIEGGSYDSASTCPLELLVKGAFVASNGVRSYSDAGPDKPSICINMVAGTREDVQETGLAVLDDSYNLETEVMDAAYKAAGPQIDDPLTVEAATADKPALLRKAVAGEYIHGWVKAVEGTGDATVIRASMSKTNDGKVPA